MCEKGLRTLVLVRLRRSGLPGRRKAPSIMHDATIAYECKDEACYASLKQIPKMHSKNVCRLLSQIYTAWKKHTYPWDDGSWRAIPCKKYQEFMDDLRKLQEELNDEVLILYNNYDIVKTDAESLLGKLWDEKKFPDREDFSNISATMSTKGIDGTNSTWIGLADEVVESVKAEEKDRIKEQAEEIMKESVRRLADVIAQLRSRLKEKDQKGKKYTHIKKEIESIVEGVKDFNISGNQELEEIASDVLKLGNFDPVNVKAIDFARDIVVSKSKKLETALRGLKL